MKKSIYLLLICIFWAFLEGPQASYGQEVIKLKMADFFPIGHISYKNSLVFIKRIHEVTHDKIKIEYYPAEQLGELMGSPFKRDRSSLDRGYGKEKSSRKEGF